MNLNGCIIYSPDAADISQIPVKDGDVILLATDGVFDNLPESMLLAELIKVLK